MSFVRIAGIIWVARWSTPKSDLNLKRPLKGGAFSFSEQMFQPVIDAGKLRTRVSLVQSFLHAQRYDGSRHRLKKEQ